MKRKRIAEYWIIVLLMLVWVSSAMALEAPTPEQIRQYQQDGTWDERLQNAFNFGNYKMDPVRASRADYKLRFLYYLSQGRSEADIDLLLTPPPAWTGMPSTGDVKIFVLLIDFNDYPHISPADDASNVDDLIFGAENTGSGNYPYESLKAYYERASYGLLTLGGATLGWYNPGTNRSAVAETTAGRESLIKGAINSFNTAGHDFSQYDNDGDGDIDYFAVIWAGPHGDWSSFWWGYQTYFSDSTYTVDGKKLSKYSWQWESYNSPEGSYDPLVLIHETGHALGLPDYYDYDVDVGPDGGVGGLDMMDGNWGDHNAFSKFVLDWLTPTVIAGEGTYADQTLRSSASYADALVIMPGASGSAFEEFFMVQHRRREKNDSTYPVDGLLIWHVNAVLNTLNTDYKYDNSYTDYKLLRLMEADGLEEIESQSASADAGDFYTTGDSFTHATTPDSDAYSGTPTGIQVTGITSAASNTTCNVTIGEAPDVSITSPADQEVVSGSVSVTATASAPSGIVQVEFFVNEASLGSDTTSPYSVTWDTSGNAFGVYTVKAVATATAGTSNFDEVTVFLVSGSTQALIFDLGSDNASGDKIGEALAMNNVIPSYGSAIGDIDPAVYPLAFVCLGYWDGNHVLTSAESVYLASYLDNGGMLYMEGGDTWSYDTQYGVHDYFGVNGVADGTYDLATVSGKSGSLSEGISFTTTGTFTWVDRIETENGGVAIWENSSPVYTCGVSNETASYKTIGCSFEFGNIDDADVRSQVMAAYLSFFGISSDSSDCPGCSGTNVVIENFTYPSGADCSCSAQTITFGPNVTVESGAKVRLTSPQVIFKQDVRVKQGADFKVNQ